MRWTSTAPFGGPIQQNISVLKAQAVAVASSRRASESKSKRVSDLVNLEAVFRLSRTGQLFFSRYSVCHRSGLVALLG